MSEMELQRLLELLKVLADESRLRMVGVLAARETTGVELASLLDLRAATVSHHLGRLRAAGLVSVRNEGTSRFYRLDRAALGSIQAQLLQPERVAAMVPEAQVGALQRKVLSAFVKGPKLLRIPASRKKRNVILQWLADDFAVGEVVEEAEVNERIGRHHYDTATLRRELIGGGWMTRKDGIYTRIDRET